MLNYTDITQKHLYPKLNGYGDNGQRSLKLYSFFACLVAWTVHLFPNRVGEYIRIVQYIIYRQYKTTT